MAAAPVWYCVIFSITFVAVQRFIAVYKLTTSVVPKNNHNAVLSDVFHNPEIFRLDYEEMERKFKVYVYPEGKPYSILQSPLRFLRSTLFLNRQRRRKVVYPFMVKNILESRFSTDDADQAHLFFLPFTRDRDIKGLIADEGRITPIINYLLKMILKYPYWVRTLGTDHFFVNCNDFNMKGIGNLTKNAIQVMCPPVNDSEFVPHKDVSLPTVRWRPPNSVLNKIRRAVLAGSAKDYRIFDHVSDETTRLSEYRKSQFCVCHKAVDVFDSIVNGCVPVIYSDYHNLPFNDILDWRKFSVIVKEGGVEHYNHILENIELPKYKQLQENLLKVWQHFVWNSPPVKYDAFHMAMYELWSRRHAIRY